MSLDTTTYKVHIEELNQELKVLKKTKEHYQSLGLEVERLAEDLYYRTQHGRQVLEMFAYAWQKDPEIQALSEQGLQKSNFLSLANNNFLEEGMHVISEKMRQAKNQEEECREHQKHLQKIIDYHNKTAGVSKSRFYG